VTYIEPQLIKATDVPDEWGFNILLYGHPGAGKTVLAASAQDSPFGADVIFLDCEAGVRSISDRPDIDVIRITEWSQLGGTYDWLTDPDNEHTYKTVVIDTITALQELKLSELLAESGDDAPSWDHWNKLNAATIRMTRDFRNLATSRGWNIIFVCWETEEKNEQTGSVLTRPAMTPASAKSIMGMVDIIAHLGFDSNGQRKLQLQGSGHLAAKVREPITGVTHLPESITDPSLVSILEIARKDK